MPAERTRSELEQLLLAAFPDNPADAITPAATRSFLLEVITSDWNRADDGTPGGGGGGGSYPLYGGLGTHTDGPIHQAGVTALLAPLAALAKPFYSADPANATKLKGYTTIDAAFVDTLGSDSYVVVQSQPSVILAGNVTAGSVHLYGHGQTIQVPAGITLDLNGPLYLTDVGLIVTGTITYAPYSMRGQTRDVGLEGTFPLNGEHSFYGVGLGSAHFTETGTVYLYDDASDPASVGPNVTVVDRRGGTGSSTGGGNYAKLTHAVTTAANFTLTLPVGATEVDYIDSIQVRTGSTRTDTARVEKIDWSFNVSTRVLSITSGAAGAELKPGDTLEVRYFTGSSTGGGSGSNTPIIQLS